MKAGQRFTGWGGYLGRPGASQWMKVLRAPRTSRWWMHRWQMLSGNGGGAGGLESADIEEPRSRSGSEKGRPEQAGLRSSQERPGYIE